MFGNKKPSNDFSIIEMIEGGEVNWELRHRLAKAILVSVTGVLASWAVDKTYSSLYTPPMSANNK